MYSSTSAAIPALVHLRRPMHLTMHRYQSPRMIVLQYLMCLGGGPLDFRGRVARVAA